MPEQYLALHSKLLCSSDTRLYSTSGRRSRLSADHQKQSVERRKSEIVHRLRSAASVSRIGSAQTLPDLVNVSMARMLLVHMSQKAKAGNKKAVEARIARLQDAHAVVQARLARHLARWEVHNRLIVKAQAVTIDSGHFPSGFGFFCCPERLYSKEKEPELSQVYDQIMVLEDDVTKDQLLSFLDDFRLRRQALSALNRQRSVLLSEVKAWIRQKPCKKLLKNIPPSFPAAIKAAQRLGDRYLRVGGQMEKLLHLKRKMSYLVGAKRERDQIRSTSFTALKYECSTSSRSLGSEVYSGDVSSSDSIMESNFPAVDEMLTCLYKALLESGRPTQLTVTKLEQKIKALSFSLQAQDQRVKDLHAAVDARRLELEALKKEGHDLQEEVEQQGTRLAGLQQERIGAPTRPEEMWMENGQTNYMGKEDGSGGANSGKNCGQDKARFAKQDHEKHDHYAGTDYDRDNDLGDIKIVIDDNFDGNVHDNVDDDDGYHDDDKDEKVADDATAAVTCEDGIWAPYFGPERKDVSSKCVEKVVEFNNSCLTELLLVEEFLLDKREEARQEEQAMVDGEREVRSLLTSAQLFAEELERQISLFPVMMASGSAVTVTQQPAAARPPAHRCRFCLCDLGTQTPAALDTHEAALSRGRRLARCHPFIQALTECRFRLSNMHRALEQVMEEAEMDLRGSAWKRRDGAAGQAGLGEFSSPDLATDRLIQACVSALDVGPCVSLQDALARARALTSTLVRFMSTLGQMQRGERSRRVARTKQEKLLQKLEGPLLEVEGILGLVALDLARLRCREKFLTKGRILKNCLCVYCRCYNSPFQDGLRTIQKFSPDESYRQKLDRLGLSKNIVLPGDLAHAEPKRAKAGRAAARGLKGKRDGSEQKSLREEEEEEKGAGTEKEDSAGGEENEESREKREKEALTYTLANLTQGLKAVILPHRPHVPDVLRGLVHVRQFLSAFWLPAARLQRGPSGAPPPGRGSHALGLGLGQGKGQGQGQGLETSADSGCPDAGGPVCAAGEAVLRSLESVQDALLVALRKACRLHSCLNGGGVSTRSLHRSIFSFETLAITQDKKKKVKG